MKTPAQSASKILTGFIMLIVIFLLSGSCTKSSDTMIGTAGNTGAKGGQTATVVVN